MDNIRDYLDKEIVTTLLHYYGASEVEEMGEHLRCACPIHGGSNKTSFVWDLKTHLFYCHGCQTGGDLIRLHAIVNDLSERNNFNNILDELCLIIGIDKTKLNYDKTLNAQRKELRTWNSYVNKNVNVNKPYDINRLGTLKHINAYRSLSKEVLQQHNVLYAKDFNRIAFQIEDENSVVVGATCRTLNAVDKIKWLHRPKGIDTGLILYNLNNVIKLGVTKVYVVEGLVDVLQLEMLGVLNVVASFGCGLTEEQINLLSKYFIEVVMFYDNDTGGSLGTLKAIESLKYKFDVYVKYFGDLQINDAGEIPNIEVFDSIETMYYENYLNKVKV